MQVKRCLSQTHCRRVERASIDEAYLDLTEEAAKLCQEAETGDAEDVANAPETDLQVPVGKQVVVRFVAPPKTYFSLLLFRWSLPYTFLYLKVVFFVKLSRGVKRSLQKAAVALMNELLFFLGYHYPRAPPAIASTLQAHLIEPSWREHV